MKKCRSSSSRHLGIGRRGKKREKKKRHVEYEKKIES